MSQVTAINLGGGSSDIKLQQMVSQKKYPTRRGPGTSLVVFISKTTMQSTIKKKSQNSVNGESTRSTSLGRMMFGQQEHPDRQQATSCNNRDNLRIGTWNVRTMYQAGKFENVKAEMNRCHIDVLGISEVRWLQSGKIISDDITMVYSGSISNHEYGVGILLNKKIAASLMGYYAISERVILVKLNGHPFNIAIIQVYAPTASSTEEQIEQFYNDLDKAKEQCKSQEVLIVMGDMNAKIGHGTDESAVGPHGLGQRNERGDKFAEWCEQHDQVNTWYKKHPRHLWTWRNPAGTAKNQIDYITIRKQCSCRCKNIPRSRLWQ